MSISVVTGGAGFIGSHLAAELSRQGHRVRVLDSLLSPVSRQRAEALAGLPEAEIIAGDIRDSSLCRRAVRGADFVFHHAAEVSVPQSIDDPAACVAVNLGGTVGLLDAARAAGTVRRFVFASSCAVYGDAAGEVKSEASPVDPLSPYASSKLAGEYLCRNFFQLHGLGTVCLRYFNVYGPDQDPDGAYAAVIPKFVTALARGVKPVVYGDGGQSRDFVFVGDVVEANLRAAAAPPGALGRAFNIGSGHSASLNQILDKLARLTGRAVEADRRAARAGDIRHSRAGVAEAARLLGFTASVGLDDGLARTLHWYQAKA